MCKLTGIFTVLTAFIWPMQLGGSKKNDCWKNPKNLNQQTYLWNYHPEKKIKDKQHDQFGNVFFVFSSKGMVRCFILRFGGCFSAIFRFPCLFLLLPSYNVSFQLQHFCDDEHSSTIVTRQITHSLRLKFFQQAQ